MGDDINMDKKDLRYTIQSLNNSLRKDKRTIIDNVYEKVLDGTLDIDEYIFAVESFREEFLDKYL